MFIPTKNSATSKSRIKFVYLMYIVFITLWCDSLYKVEEAERIIEEQEAYIALHNRTTEELESVYVMLDCLHKEKDVLITNLNYTTGYIDEFFPGYQIDWQKAFEINTPKEIKYDESYLLASVSE